MISMVQWQAKHAEYSAGRVGDFKSTEGDLLDAHLEKIQPII